MKKLFILCFVVASLVFTGPILAADSQPVASPAVLVNINNANAADLERLPGIGKSTALQIIQYRTEKGRFVSTQDLIKVKGVGPKTLEKIIDQITVK